jgi:indole-3-glycerol phosphate synthase
VKKNVKIPVLRKDFIIDELQLIESAYYQADAVLLIASILPLRRLKALMKKADELLLDYIVEVHDEEELKTALKTDCQLIGVNNRNLKTFAIDLNTSLKLYKEIPRERKTIVESGIASLRDVLLYTEVGIDTFLIGQMLMSQGNPGEMIREIKNLRS